MLSIIFYAKRKIIFRCTHKRFTISNYFHFSAHIKQWILSTLSWSITDNHTPIPYIGKTIIKCRITLSIPSSTDLPHLDLQLRYVAWTTVIIKIANYILVQFWTVTNLMSSIAISPK
jgi:hypothetical protein